MECQICLEPIENIKTLKCGHQGCSECLNKWIQLKGNCPWCRKIIKINSDYNFDYLEQPNPFLNFITGFFLFCFLPIFIINWLWYKIFQKIINFLNYLYD